MVDKRVARVVLLGLASVVSAFSKAPTKHCQAYPDLLATGHLSIHVNISGVQQGDGWAMKEALKYWSTVLDMDFTVDNDPTTCNLELVYADEDSGRLAYTIQPHYDGFDGIIHYNTHKRMKCAALVALLVHELGHVFGLCHTRDRLSAMYYLVDAGQAVNGARLDAADIAMVGKFHALHKI